MYDTNCLKAVGCQGISLCSRRTAVLI